MEELMVMIYVRCMILRDNLLESVHNFITDEKGDVNIVSIVVLIGIAVLLAVIFRDRIETLIGTLFDTIDNSAAEAIQ